MSLLFQDPPPPDAWTAIPQETDGIPAYLLEPRDPSSSWPGLRLSYRASSLSLQAVIGNRPGYLFFTLPEPLQRQPIVGLRRDALPSSPEAAATAAIAMLSGLCGTRVQQARSYLSLLATIAAFVANDDMARLRLRLPSGEVQPVLSNGPGRFAAPLFLPRLAAHLRGCPLLRGATLYTDPEVTSLLSLPDSAHARMDKVAHLLAALPKGFDDLTSSALLDALRP